LRFTLEANEARKKGILKDREADIAPSGVVVPA